MASGRVVVLVRSILSRGKPVEVLQCALLVGGRSVVINCHVRTAPPEVESDVVVDRLEGVGHLQVLETPYPDSVGPAMPEEGGELLASENASVSSFGLRPGCAYT